MAGVRRTRILAQLVGDAASPLDAKRLCDVCADIVDMSGAGIMLMSDGAPRGALCASNSVSAFVEQLQYNLGEGPSLDASRQRAPILEPDLAAAAERWVAFSGPALEAGVRAVFSFPLHVGAVRLGVMDLYCDRPGALTRDQHADALVMADVSTEVVLGLQANAPAGTVAAELEAGANFQYVVHQASGMVAVQMGVNLVEAQVRLRAHAFATNQTLAMVARQVVARGLRFDAESGEPERQS